MTASPQDAPGADSLPSCGDAGAQASVSGPSGPAEAAQEAVEGGGWVDDLGDGFTPYIATIAEALAATPNGRAAAAYAKARYRPGATFTHGYTSGGRLPEADPSIRARAGYPSPDAMFDGLERRTEG